MSAGQEDKFDNVYDRNCKNGGYSAQLVHAEDHKIVPTEVRENQLIATVHGYRSKVIEDGIPNRSFNCCCRPWIAHKKYTRHYCPHTYLAVPPAGLFPPGDLLLEDLTREQDCHPFEKHLSGLQSPYELLQKGSWVSGNSAAKSGFDLRLFYRARRPEEEHGSLIAAARLGDKASIGNGYWMSAHGGAIESLLDEGTAELAKMEFTPLLSTIEAIFRLKKPVPLHTTLRIDCQVTSITGLRCWVHGEIKLPDTDTVLATCDAQLADLQPILAAQKA